jgi:CubicO group peptidase (beta-lactamase class C family)
MRNPLLRACLLLLLSLHYAPFASSQTIQTGSTLPGNVDKDRLARIDSFVNGYIDRGWLNGAVVLLVLDGKVIEYKGYGYADKEARKPMQKDDLFRIASQTKAIVTAGIMQLFEEGKFYLDEPIADFLPAFRDTRVLDKFNAADTTYTTVPAKRQITFRDILTHTSGIDYALIGSPNMKAIYAKAGIPSGIGVADYDLKERMETLARLPLARQPGEKWAYSLGIDLAGCLIEVITGKNLEDYLHERIFLPLGMHDTFFNVPGEKAGRLVAVYTEDSLHHIIRWPSGQNQADPNYPLVHKRYFSGGAGLTSTAWDYAIFLQMFLNGGAYNGARILSPRTVQLMTSGQLPSPFNGSDYFGLGFGITSAQSAAREVRNEGSFSWGGYFGTTYWADPKQRLVGLVMTQQTPNSHGDFEHRLEQIIYSSFK